MMEIPVFPEFSLIMRTKNGMIRPRLLSSNCKLLKQTNTYCFLSAYNEYCQDMNPRCNTVFYQSHSFHTFHQYEVTYEPRRNYREFVAE